MRSAVKILKEILSSTKDLFDKLIEPPFGDLFDTNINKLVERKLREVVNGEIIYDNREKDFIFKKDQGSSVPIRNTASGIKVFGILQLLSSNDFINKKSLLVFDEPENHLHPALQKTLLPNLMQAFPDVQFIIVSHNKHIISSVKDCSIYVLDYNENSKVISKRLNGLDDNRSSEDILNDALGMN